MEADDEAMSHDAVGDAQTPAPAHDAVRDELSSLRLEVSRLRTELGEARSEAVVAQFVKENVQELERERNGLGEEMATLRQLLSESHDEASVSKVRFESELGRATMLATELERENRELRIQAKLAEKDGLISGVDRDKILGSAAAISDVTKSLARKVKCNLQTVVMPNAVAVETDSAAAAAAASAATAVAASSAAAAAADADLEEGLKRASEDTELLRAIVVPLEEQIAALKDKLRETDTLLRETERRQASSTFSSLSGGRVTGEDGRVTDGRVTGEEAVRIMEARLAEAAPTTTTHDADDAEKQASSAHRELYISLLLGRQSLLRAEVDAAAREKEELAKLLVEQRKAISDSAALESGSASLAAVASDAAAAAAADETHGIEQLRQRIEALEKAEEKYKAELSSEASYRKEVESRWNERAEQHRSETEALISQVRRSEELLERLRVNYSTMYEATRKDLQSLTLDRDKIVRELRRLQDENDALVGKHGAKALEMQNEVIDLPDSMEDMQLLLLRYREDLIAAKVAKERLEEKLSSEVGFLKAQLSSEIQTKESMDEQLAAETSELKERIYVLESYKSEFEAEKRRREEFEGNEQKQKRTQAEMSTQMEVLGAEKRRLEASAAELRNRIANLQTELDNSVAVQTDFVRLSQSLQMELEKIRQAEKEVRWQHEDDVEDCNGCRSAFSNVTRRKHHCRHCGRVFCSECISKAVRSGPHGRVSRVCDVCHTLLAKNSAPYFATEAPHHAGK